MNKDESVRYPQSADLFRFCKEALNIKHNFEVKVIDQHVGAILGFDPADCSHWKKGKKNIKSLQTVNAIAQHLDVDSRIVSDLVSGKVDLEQSIQEFKGYGPTQPSQKFYEELKKEYFRDPSRFAHNGRSRSIDEVMNIDRNMILDCAQKALDSAGVKSCPVLLPEIVDALDHVSLDETPLSDRELVKIVPSNGEQTWTIQVRAGDTLPHTRFLTAKAIGKILLAPADALRPDDSSELLDAQSYLFASLLLMPKHLFALAMREVDDTQDIVQQLSEIFWMSRSLVNSRLKDYFRNGN